MKRCSFNVAQAIKEAGYPQNIKSTVYYSSNGYLCTDGSCNYVCAAPYVMKVWLWLWRVKGYRIREEITKITIYDNSEIGYTIRLDNLTNDPEEAIIMAIEYLVDNNLLV